jgi:hypothetical protein
MHGVPPSLLDRIKGRAGLRIHRMNRSSQNLVNPVHIKASPTPFLMRVYAIFGPRVKMAASGRQGRLAMVQQDGKRTKTVHETVTKRIA